MAPSTSVGTGTVASCSRWSSSRRVLLEAALEPGGEVVGGVGRRLGAEQVERHGVVEVEVLLDHGHVDAAEGADVVGVVLLHQLDGALHARARRRWRPTNMWCASSFSMKSHVRDSGSNAALPQRRQLVLAVAVGEVGEHEERQPVRRLLVERAEDARVVGVARVALEHLVGLVAAVTPEVAVQQVHHRPQVPALLDVDLEQVAQVVEARRGEAQVALLLHRGRLGVALDDDQAAQVGAGTRPAPPATPARPCGRRSRSPGRGRARPGRCPSGSRASSRGRSWPSPPGRRRSRCAGRRRGPGRRRARASATTRGTGAATTPAPAAGAGRRRGRRCSGSWRRSRQRSLAITSCSCRSRAASPVP